MPTGSIDLEELEKDDDSHSQLVRDAARLSEEVIERDEKDDAVVSALESRARDLSLAIVNPATLATKLRESLIDIAGPDAAVTYHIGASYDHQSRQVNVQIARVSPSFVALLKSDLYKTSLEFTYQKRTDGGWNVAVGVQIEAESKFTGLSAKSGTVRRPPGLKPPKGSNVKASFSVTLSR